MASVVLPLRFCSFVGCRKRDPQRVRVLAILGTLAATVLIWVVDGNDNPRYEYVLLPLLAPVVGFVWTAWERREVGFQQVLLGVGVLMCGAGAMVAVKVPSVGIDRVFDGRWDWVRAREFFWSASFLCVSPNV